MPMTVNAPILHSLPGGCICAEFIRRIKRFSVELRLHGKTVWAHTNNSGAMLGLLRSGAPALLSPAVNPERKLPWTLERIWVHTGRRAFWAGVNTYMPNRLLIAAFRHGSLDFACGYTSSRVEARHGESRLDARLDGPRLPPLWVECKNVTLVRDNTAMFPDARSSRAQKHLLELMAIKESGQRAAMFYLIQRPDAEFFSPASDIDPDYADLYHEARKKGVEIYPFVAEMRREGIALGKLLQLA